MKLCVFDVPGYPIVEVYQDEDNPSVFYLKQGDQTIMATGRMLTDFGLHNPEIQLGATVAHPTLDEMCDGIKSEELDQILDEAVARCKPGAGEILIDILKKLEDSDIGGVPEVFMDSQYVMLEWPVHPKTCYIEVDSESGEVYLRIYNGETLFSDFVDQFGAEHIQKIRDFLA